MDRPIPTIFSSFFTKTTKETIFGLFLVSNVRKCAQRWTRTLRESMCLFVLFDWSTTKRKSSERQKRKFISIDPIKWKQKPILYRMITRTVWFALKRINEEHRFLFLCDLESILTIGKKKTARTEWRNSIFENLFVFCDRLFLSCWPRNRIIIEFRYEICRLDGSRFVNHRQSNQTRKSTFARLIS